MFHFVEKIFHPIRSHVLAKDGSSGWANRMRSFQRQQRRRVKTKGPIAVCDRRL